ncbi:MAG: trehalose-phosphatase, partial [Candidatus Limnocylindrales bacterium]
MRQRAMQVDSGDEDRDLRHHERGDDGRLIVELRPIGAGGKGAAVGRLLAELEPVSVLALGDDRSDAEGFRLLRSERTASRLVALTIGVHDRLATPVEVIEAADVMLSAPRDAGRLLGALVRILAAEVDPVPRPGSDRASGPTGPTRT